MKDLMRDELEKEILMDGINGDTTVLADLLSRLSDEVIWNALSDTAQAKFRKPFAIKTSDGHDDNWTYYDSELEAHDTFIYMQGYEDNIHLYQLNKDTKEYEVIDSWSTEE